MKKFNKIEEKMFKKASDLMKKLSLSIVLIILLLPILSNGSTKTAIAVRQTLHRKVGRLVLYL